MAYSCIVTAYLHSHKEQMADLGEKIGLSGKALNNFMYALCEVAFKLQVNEDGTYQIIEVDGVPHGEPSPR